MRPASLASLLVLGLALSSGTGCYLFSDEPKARKLSEAGADAGEQGQAAEGAAASKTPAAEGAELPPAERPDRPADCPSLLVGVAADELTIPAACGFVTVRGAYRVEGGSLTLEPGVELRFEPGGALEVGLGKPGKLIALGTDEQPVRMVAASGHEAGSSWVGVRLHPGAAGSRLEQLEIVGAGTAEHAALRIDTPELSVAQLRVLEAPGLALELGERAQGVQLLSTTLSSAAQVLARATPMGAAGLLDLRLEPGSAIEILPGKIDAPIEWPRNNYRIQGTIEIAGTSEDARPAQLSLAPGVELGFGPAGRLIVGGLGPGVLSASAPPLPSLLAPDPSANAGPPEVLSEATILRAAGDGEPGAWSGVQVREQGELILRNIELAYGGSRDEGVIVAEAGAKLSLEGCSLRSNLVGIELRSAELEIETLRDNEFLGTPVALRASPSALAKLELGANRYGEGVRVELTRGQLEHSASWDARGVALVLTGDVYVDRGATLSVSPGSRLYFAKGAQLGVGYYADSSLELRGTSAEPIELGPFVAPPASPDAPPSPATPWGGVVLGPYAHKVRFEQLRLANTAKAGIELRDGADATLVAVECRDCGGPTVSWDCESTIGNIGVSATGSTPEALSAPSGCK